MLRSLLCLLALASSHALRLAMTRRAAIASTPALLSPLVANANKNPSSDPYACRGKDDCNVGAGSKAMLLETPGQGAPAGVRFSGTYSDPSHPGCPRKVTLAGSNAIITGKDQVDGKEWKAKAKPNGKYLLIDFSSKGGESAVLARYTGVGLAFEDGTVWTKK